MTPKKNKPMRKSTLVTLIFLLMFIGHNLYAQPVDSRGFRMAGTNPEIIQVNQTLSSTTDLKLFPEKMPGINGLSVTSSIVLNGSESFVRFILTDTNYNEYLVFETYELLASGTEVSIEDLAEETAILNGIRPLFLRIELQDASVNLKNISYTTALPPGIEMARIKQERNMQRHEEKIRMLNQNLRDRGFMWVAGHTEVSALSYSERKQLYGDSKFPSGIEYYTGGILEAGPGLKSATASPMVDMWDWRNRHGVNWVTSVKNQGGCGSCWAFAVTGATEALVNLFYNRKLDLNLSEQDVLSCSGAGSCSGGYPSTALNYITNTGIVDEAAFPYKASDLPCTDKSPNPTQLIKIGGRVDFGTTTWPREEDALKKMIIKYGPISGGISDWSHAMTLVGYQVVKAGDKFYTRDLNKSTYWLTVPEGSSLIGTTVWMFKNSWGGTWGDAGYVYVQTSMANVGWTHALLTPVQSLKQTYTVNCEDKDGDGYYWWGLGPKPANCDCPDLADGDDSNPNLGPLDEYGNCIVLGAPPVADFTSDITSVPAGKSVSFTDLSKNAPTSWSWSFPGGNPGTSTDRNPVVIYPTMDTFDVTLTVKNASGENTVKKTGYITVTEPVYCDSKGGVSEEWIESVSIGSDVHSSTKTTGYQDFTAKTFTVQSGTTQNFTLKPAFSNARKPKTEYWRIWIDLNNDKDFDDPGELLFTSALSNTTVTGIITIPPGLNLTTRMRISMKRSVAPGACEIFSQGEVEDYTVTITPPAPVELTADFSASSQSVYSGEYVQFTDLSVGYPVSWAWTFSNGTTSITSNDRNPNIQFNSAGNYGVTLVVSDGNTTKTETKTGYISVTDAPPVTYCEPMNISTTGDFIKGVSLGSISTSNTPSSGYRLNSGPYNLTAGTSYAVTLTPATTSNRNFWRIWLDVNGDSDFDDSGETLLAVNNKKGAFTANITIPASLSLTTRLRISMRTGSSPAPCDDSFSGEVEDYVVTIGAGLLAIKNASLEFAENGTASIRLYPNPTNDRVTLKLGKVSPGDSYTLYNSLGTLVRQKEITGLISQVEMESFAPGMYLIVINNSNQIYREKILKQ
jgi:PKD repeat protein/C1A family cysteine protease